jgi:antitoxin Phd
MYWQLQEAKNKLNEVIDKTLKEGPQVITRREHEVVVVISIKEYEQNKLKDKKLGDFFHDSPLTPDLFDNRNKDIALREINL